VVLGSDNTTERCRQLLLGGGWDGSRDGGSEGGRHALSYGRWCTQLLRCLVLAARARSRHESWRYVLPPPLAPGCPCAL